MKFDLSKLLEISARTAGAITIACIILLFFPATWLPFDIEKLRTDNGMWIFIILVVSIAIWSSYFLKWIAESIKKKIDKHKIWSTYKYILKNLSNSEKLFLKEYYDKRETAILLDLCNPIHKRLQTFKVVSMTAGYSAGGIGVGFPGFIQPWVFQLIDKNPGYLKLD